MSKEKAKFVALLLLSPPPFVLNAVISENVPTQGGLVAIARASPRGVHGDSGGDDEDPKSKFHYINILIYINNTI